MATRLPWDFTQTQATAGVTPECLSSLYVDGQQHGSAAPEPLPALQFCSLGLGFQLSATKMAASKQNLLFSYKLSAQGAHAGLEHATQRCTGDSTVVRGEVRVELGAAAGTDHRSWGASCKVKPNKWGPK